MTRIKDPKAKQDALDKAAIGYLVHVPTLFLTDVPDFTQGIAGYTIDADKTYLKSVKNFPGNLVVNDQVRLHGAARRDELFRA